MRTTADFLPSAIVCSLGAMTMLLLALPRPAFATLRVLVTERGPEPPAIAGLPMPSLSCVSFALRARDADAPAVASIGGSTRVVAVCWLLSCSTSSWTTTLEVEVKRVFVEDVRLDVRERVEARRAEGAGAGGGGGRGGGTRGAMLE